MKLIIGGYAQGKLEYVRRELEKQQYFVSDGELPESGEQIVIINHLHAYIRKELEKGNLPKADILAFIRRHPDCILISDEIGNGIVPIDSFEREYREQAGWILTDLAKEAEEVVRVICGIGQKLK